MIDLRKFIDWVVAKQNIIGLVSTVIIILLSIYGYTQGVFTDKSKQLLLFFAITELYFDNFH